MSSNQKSRIVITGLGVISSIGIGKEDFWNNLIQGESGISRIESFDTSHHGRHLGGEVKNFKPEQFIGAKKIGLIGRASQLAIAASKLALKDSKMPDEILAAKRAGVLVGTTMGEPQRLEEIDKVWSREGTGKLNKRLIFQYPANSIPANVASELKLKGHNRIFTTACSAGNYAIGYGFDLLKLNKLDLVLAGGSEAFSYIAFTGFNQFGLIAPEKCQPFDKERKGIIVGEGAGMLVLETLESAKERGANIYAEVLGYGLSCDASHMTLPSKDGIVRCLRNALKESGIKEKEVDYISAHGTGTLNNDKTESEAIREVFAENYQNIPASSIKSMLGHTMGAASAIEAIACCLAITNSIIPPTINHFKDDPECGIDCVPNAARRKELGIVLNNGFAFGGNNACVVFKKH